MSGIRTFALAMAVMVTMALGNTGIAVAQFSCGEGYEWNQCWVPLFEWWPEGPQVQVNFVIGSYPGDWPIIARTPDNHQRCTDATAVAEMWSLDAVDMGVSMSCDENETLSLSDGQPTITWDDLSGTNLCGDCPSGIDACTCLYYYCPTSGTAAAIVDADIFVHDSGITGGPPPAEYDSSWDADETLRAILSHEFGASFNFADASPAQTDEQVRTMALGSRGHWSAGDDDVRVHPMPAEAYCMKSLYGADDDETIDFTISNSSLDASGDPYETGWSHPVRGPSLLSDICPGEDFDYQYTAYNRIPSNPLTLALNDPFEVALWVSEDQDFDSGSDVRFHTDTLYYTPGYSEAVDASTTLPSNIGLSLDTDYYIFAEVDPDDDYSEDDETNNVLLLRGKLHTKPSCP